jgi:hypothetical protein
MPLDVIVKPVFANVPLLDGVPTVLRKAGAIPVVRAVLSKVEGELWRMLTTESKWGVFTAEGKLIAQADSVIDVGYRNNSRVVSHPVQRGGFGSYNKVASPFEATVRLSKGGGVSTLGVVKSLLAGGGLSGAGEKARGDFLDAIDKASKTTDLYHVVTPEKTYINCNIQSYSYRREQSNGAHRIDVELQLIEVRQTSAKYGKTTVIIDPKDAGAATPVSGGRVQAAPPPQSWLLKGAQYLTGK